MSGGDKLTVYKSFVASFAIDAVCYTLGVAGCVIAFSYYLNMTESLDITLFLIRAIAAVSVLESVLGTGCFGLVIPFGIIVSVRRYNFGLKILITVRAIYVT